MEYLKNLNNKAPDIGGTSSHDNSVKEMYSCARKTSTTPAIANLLGFIALVSFLFLAWYRISNKNISYGEFTKFTTDLDMRKMFIGLLLLSNIKTLSNSMIENVILPIVKPILPLISCNFRINIGLFDMEIGSFISDMIVFLLNTFVIFFFYNLL
jgi:large-conductance mechanosensitive channel